jgi:SRSO17 transposase
LRWSTYLPEIWADDSERPTKAKIPDEILFQTKPQIALEQIRAALARQTPVGVILADAGYGADGGFRRGLTELGLAYAVGVQATLSVWRPGEGPLSPKAWSGKGRPPKLMGRSADHQPLSAKALAEDLPAEVWQTITWREGSNVDLASRFAAVRVRVASRDYNLRHLRAEEWLLVEWPEGDKEPLKYWLSTLPETSRLHDLVATTKLRWRIERDYRALKQELGLGHYEGRGWRGFHHHASLGIAAYGFLLSKRETFPAQHLPLPKIAKNLPFPKAPDPAKPPIRHAPRTRSRRCVGNSLSPSLKD